MTRLYRRGSGRFAKGRQRNSARLPTDPFAARGLFYLILADLTPV